MDITLAAGGAATAKRESDERGGEAGVAGGWRGEGSGRGGEAELRCSFVACSHLLLGSGGESRGGVGGNTESFPTIYFGQVSRCHPLIRKKERLFKSMDI